MKKVNSHQMYWERIFIVVLSLVLFMGVGCAMSGSNATEQSAIQPMVIPGDALCGKCGMYPAKFPRWQSQIIFKDGSMTPFDGCKCMFNFMFAMDKYDKAHTMDDVSAILVKGFNSGEWMSGADAYFVVGSNMMGPMGKELIPFADKAAAMEFHKEQGGNMMTYAEITPEVLKSLMGNMNKHGNGSKHMKMKM
jgi:copper chaperone NosL